MRALISTLAMIALCLGLATAQRGQAREPRVIAQLTTGVTKLGAELALVVVVENAGFANLHEVPPVEGLKIGPVGSPRSMRSTTMINGRTTFSDERRWIVPVMPQRTGEFTIPPLSVDVDGTLVHTPALPLTVVEDLLGEDLGYFELSAAPPKVVEGQPFTLELVFGWDQGLANKINYANLSLPWWGQLPGALEMDPPAARPGATKYDIRLNSGDTIQVEEIEPRRVRGRPFRSFRARRIFTPTRAESLQFPTSFLEFGQVRERGGFFDTRQEKVETYYVSAEAFTIEVVPLPEEGRPLDYGGAIGSLTARATAEPRDVDVGDSIKFSVEYAGSGNLEFFAAPEPSRLESFEGFRVYGKTEKKEPDRRTIVYDIAPTRPDVSQVPSLPLPVFDPEVGRYVTVATTPLPIRVRALEGAVELANPEDESGPARDIRDIHAEATQDGGGSRPGFGLTLGVAIAAPIVALGLRLVSRRQGDPDAPMERRRRGARRKLARGLTGARDARSRLVQVHAFLAARTYEDPAAWEGRDFDVWLAEQGVQGAPEKRRAAAQGLAELTRELERAVWDERAQGAASASDERILAAADEWIGAGL